MTAPTMPTPSPQPDAPCKTLHEPVITWFDEHARDLPCADPAPAPGA